MPPEENLSQGPEVEAPPPPDEGGSVWDSLVTDEPDEEGPPPEPPPAEEPPVEAAPATEEPPPEPPVEPPPIQQQQQPQVPAVDPQELRKHWVDTLEKFYTISDDDLQELESDPRKVLARVAAKVHAQVLNDAYQWQQRALPQLVGQLTQRQTKFAEASNAFFSANPDLRGQDALVTQIAVAYRSMNPNASLTDASDAVARLSRAYLNKPTAPSPAAPPPSAPARPGVPTGRVSRPAQQQPQNPFEALAMEMLQEDKE